MASIWTTQKKKTIYDIDSLKSSNTQTYFMSTVKLLQPTTTKMRWFINDMHTKNCHSNTSMTPQKFHRIIPKILLAIFQSTIAVVVDLFIFIRVDSHADQHRSEIHYKSIECHKEMIKTRWKFGSLNPFLQLMSASSKSNKLEMSVLYLWATKSEEYLNSQDWMVARLHSMNILLWHFFRRTVTFVM